MNSLKNNNRSTNQTKPTLIDGKLSQAHSRTGVAFKRNLLAMCVMALSVPAFAQTIVKTDVPDSAENIDEVIITGVRANLQTSQEIKRNAATFVDA
ncbi:MAG: hypothetical protein EOO68_34265, partial [Moraxellaceae bacterium]